MLRPGRQKKRENSYTVHFMTRSVDGEDKTKCHGLLISLTLINTIGLIRYYFSSRP